ncbi:probable LRR receptor-like serine/threonine-protein kinase At1g53430 [Eucalyptus grandis]|uniref:probable LRR receptor-like serine/threonine-protein kinase At1g53430 n=1 Tax=Eucalyptus grandis TaxID=71139 RepID=UPI00192EA0D3|nr:probable LRR receptor-like serine/threonine-protein kinase At1g53430 [Eucalyptus grandis]
MMEWFLYVSRRISDLKGPSSNFPNLKGMDMMKTLILRNCLLIGSIPDYIGYWTSLKTLDLSINRLTGQVPDTMEAALDYMFLTNNCLTGAVPSWVTSSKHYLDLSYNNFNSSSLISCQQSQVNLVSSYSSKGNNSLWCMEKDLPCSGKAQYHSLFINCGGTKMTFEGNQYVEDTSPNGPSIFSSSSFGSSEKWAYSSTGLYMGKSDASYTANNPFFMNVNGSEFYQTARLSPGSIRYYGLCMMKGSYKVRLHFAEIQYSDDETFSSLGRRIFDVSIQGNQVLKDFNIVEEAGGVGKGIYRDFDNIYVNGGTLEIHLYWSGKGTTAIPDRGVYGPLISAIAVTSNFDVGSAGLSAGAITGIAVASVVLLILILLILWLTGFFGNK